MSQQQLLLVILGVIIFSIFIAVGVTLFVKQGPVHITKEGKTYSEASYRIIKIDKCEYIYFTDNDRGYVHKGDCKNPEHRQMVAP